MPDSLALLVIIFVASLALLVYGANKFIDAAEKVGLSLGIPPFVIGVTVVALGTSLPELVSSIIAILEGKSTIVMGNVVGSNITNILLILGVVGVVAKSFTIDFNFKKLDLPFLIITSAFAAWASWDLQISTIEGITGASLLVAYIILSLQKGNDLKDKNSPKLKPTILLWLVLGGLGIYFGARYNVKSIIKMGDVLEIAPSIIALTAVALGTSLPELFVSLAAIRKGKAEIAVGNVLGSNIFNAAGIVGFSRFVGPIEVNPEIKSESLIIMGVATILFIAFIWNKRVVRWEGAALLLLYIAFIYFSFFR